MSIKIKQIAPQLLVRDLEEAISFYTQQLGFTLDFRYEDFYAGIEKDGHSIHLKLGRYSVEEGAGKRNAENLDLIFSVEDISIVFLEVSGKDIEIVQPLRQMPYGSEFYIADKDGHLIAFMES